MLVLKKEKNRAVYTVKLFAFSLKDTFCAFSHILKYATYLLMAVIFFYIIDLAISLFPFFFSLIQRTLLKPFLYMNLWVFPFRLTS